LNGAQKGEEWRIEMSKKWGKNERGE